MKWFIIVFSLVFFSGCKNGGAPEFKDGELTWFNLEQVQNIDRGDKKILVDVYTDWCGWCKVMDKKTFTDPNLIKYLNENFYVVKFNAEQKESIKFNGSEYVWQPMGRNGINTLGIELLQGNMGYPSLVYMDSNFKTIKISPGYKTPEQLLEELKAL